MARPKQDKKEIGRIDSLYFLFIYYEDHYRALNCHFTVNKTPWKPGEEWKYEIEASHLILGKAQGHSRDPERAIKAAVKNLVNKSINEVPAKQTHATTLKKEAITKIQRQKNCSLKRALELWEEEIEIRTATRVKREAASALASAKEYQRELSSPEETISTSNQPKLDSLKPLTLKSVPKASETLAENLETTDLNLEKKLSGHSLAGLTNRQAEEVFKALTGTVEKKLALKIWNELEDSRRQLEISRDKFKLERDQAREELELAKSRREYEVSKLSQCTEEYTEKLATVKKKLDQFSSKHQETCEPQEPPADTFLPEVLRRVTQVNELVEKLIGDSQAILKESIKLDQILEQSKEELNLSKLESEQLKDELQVLRAEYEELRNEQATSTSFDFETISETSSTDSSLESLLSATESLLSDSTSMQFSEMIEEIMRINSRLDSLEARQSVSSENSLLVI